MEELAETALNLEISTFQKLIRPAIETRKYFKQNMIVSDEIQRFKYTYNVIADSKLQKRFSRKSFFFQSYLYISIQTRPRQSSYI